MSNPDRRRHRNNQDLFDPYDEIEIDNSVSYNAEYYAGLNGVNTSFQSLAINFGLAVQPPTNPAVIFNTLQPRFTSIYGPTGISRNSFTNSIGVSGLQGNAGTTGVDTTVLQMIGQDLSTMNTNGAGLATNGSIVGINGGDTVAFTTPGTPPSTITIPGTLPNTDLPFTVIASKASTLSRYLSTLSSTITSGGATTFTAVIYTAPPITSGTLTFTAQTPLINYPSYTTSGNVVEAIPTTNIIVAAGTSILVLLYISAGLANSILDLTEAVVSLEFS